MLGKHMAPFLDKRERAEEVAKLSQETWKPILNHETKNLLTHQTWKPIQNTETWKPLYTMRHGNTS